MVGYWYFNDFYEVIMLFTIFLTGMPGAGKTFWGKKIAKSFNLPFFDLDGLIEENQGKKIHEILKPGSESEFRKLEAEVLKHFIKMAEKPFVLSCGGGTIVPFTSREILKRNGKIIYLKADIKTLVQNLRHKHSRRPLLKGMEADPEKFLENLLNTRKKFYEDADFILPVENLSVKDFEPILQLCLKQA